jgi:hypothetical protein
MSYYYYYLHIFYGYDFEEVEPTERGLEMLRNGNWNWETLIVFLREKIAWLGDGILVDGTRGAQSMAIPFFQLARPILRLTKSVAGYGLAC